MARDIDLVVFDMDGVLVELDRARRLTLLAELSGQEPAFLQAMIWDSDFEPAAEVGAYGTGAQYLAELNRRAGCQLSREQWVRARREAMTVRDEVLQLARELSAQVGIALLTNNGALLYEALPEIVPELYRLFGARAHASYQFAARKPMPEVFSRLLARYAVAPSRALFIDDCAEFVAGARAAGLHGIEFTSAADLRAALRALGMLS